MTTTQPQHIDADTARDLAELVLSMQMVTLKGQAASRLARRLLGIDDCGNAPDVVAITTNGTTRMIPRDEPVFLLRAQDMHGAATVRAWADLAAANGASDAIVSTARAHADRMQAWARKKIPDLAPQGADGRPEDDTAHTTEAAPVASQPAVAAQGDPRLTKTTVSIKYTSSDGFRYESTFKNAKGDPMGGLIDGIDELSRIAALFGASERAHAAFHDAACRVTKSRERGNARWLATAEPDAPPSQDSHHPA